MLAVKESDNIGTTDNKLGDFTDKNRTADDYDDNGNLIYDKNKKITSIEYNHLNLPWKITVNNDDGATTKGTITYIYDATGDKLEKRTNELLYPNKLIPLISAVLFMKIMCCNFLDMKRDVYAISSI